MSCAHRARAGRRRAGIKGEVRLNLFSDSVESLSNHEKLYVGGAERRLRRFENSGKTAVARFEGVSDRGAAAGARAIAGGRSDRRTAAARGGRNITPT